MRLLAVLFLVLAARASAGVVETAPTVSLTVSPAILPSIALTGPTALTLSTPLLAASIAPSISANLGLSAAALKPVIPAASKPDVPSVVKAVVKGRIFTTRFRSDILGDSRGVTVYLPPGYDDSKDRYPVVYAQDGQNLFDDETAFGGTSWGLGETLDRLIAEGRMRPVIVVAPHNTANRTREYGPGIDAQFGAGIADDYGRFLVSELMPAVDAGLRTEKGPKNSALLGSSLGGLVSLYLSLKRPGDFGAAAVLSPSLWWGIDRAAGTDADPLLAPEIVKLLADVPADVRVRLWADIGDAEGREPSGAEDVGLSKRSKNRYAKLETLLRAAGWTDADLAGGVFPGAEHREAYWRARVGLALAFLFPPVIR